MNMCTKNQPVLDRLLSQSNILSPTRRELEINIENAHSKEMTLAELSFEVANIWQMCNQIYTIDFEV